jgi:hypothetical protein
MLRGFVNTQAGYVGTLLDLFPRECIRSVADTASSVLGDESSSATVDNDEGWNAADAVLLAQLVLGSSVAKRQRQPGHLVKVPFPRGFIAVGADEDYLKLVAVIGFVLLVKLHQIRGKTTTRWTPVRAEVDTDNFVVSSQRLDSNFLSTSIHDFSAKKFFQGGSHLADD